MDLVRPSPTRRRPAPTSARRCTPSCWPGAPTPWPATTPADDPLRVVLAGHEDDPGPSALAPAAARVGAPAGARAPGRRAGDVLPVRGRDVGADGGWRAFLTLLAEHPDEVRAWLDRPPQTNEVGPRHRALRRPAAAAAPCRGPAGPARRDRLVGRAEPARRPLRLPRRRRPAVRRPTTPTLVIEGAWRGRAPRAVAGPARRGADRQRRDAGRRGHHRGPARAHGVRLARPDRAPGAAARRAAGRRRRARRGTPSRRRPRSSRGWSWRPAP